MAQRANWRGFLKLSLVSCSIDMVQATSIGGRIRFNINRDTGNRVRYRDVDAETGEEVPQEDRVKGYKAADGSYVLLDPEKLDEVALESPVRSISRPSCRGGKSTKSASMRPTTFSLMMKSVPTPSGLSARQCGKTPPAPRSRPSNVINLMDALRRSVRSNYGGGGAGLSGRGSRAERHDRTVRRMRPLAKASVLNAQADQKN